MQSNLNQISALGQKDKTQAYLSLLDSTLSDTTNLLQNLSLFLDAILSDSLAQIVARPCLTEYVAKLESIEPEMRREVMSMSIAKMQPRVTSFEEQVSTVRERYAELLIEDEDFSGAAKCLIGIPIDASGRSVESKLGIYIKIVSLFLEEEDSTSADTYFNRASLIYHTTSDLKTQLQYKVCQARMFDYGRKFSEAASKYHDLSYVPQVDETERMNCLSSAITCAVLAPAGPTRSRILSSLFRDERSVQSEHHTILSKMFLDQIIRPSEVTGFSSTLKPHQLARLPSSTTIVIAEDAPEETGKKGPETVLDRAVMEHNVLSASRIYNNITFAGLGLLLELRPSAAEAMARTMIQQGRLKGSLDQVDQLIIFDADTKDGDGVVSNVAAAAAGGDDDMEKEEQGTAPATKRWDMQIRQTLQLAESIAARCEVLLAGGTPAIAGVVAASA
ncbi:COP9 signalosome complex subunit 4, partial [Phenoliferia sp. Uapishka_3]